MKEWGFKDTWIYLFIYLLSPASSGLDSQDSLLQISACDFSAAVEGFQPSVSEVELQRYRNIQSQLAAK